MNQKGLALITVIVVFAIVLVTVAGTIVLTRTESSTSKTNERAEQAFSLAEAGIDWAAAKLRANPQFAITSTTLISQTGQTQVIITRTSSKVTVISTGNLASGGTDTPTAQRAIKVEFLSQQGFDAGGMWDRAVTANGHVDASGNINIRWDDPVNGPTTQSNLVAANSIQFTGNINVLGSPGVGYVPGGSARLIGNTGQTTVGQVPPDPVEDIDLSYWRNLCLTQPGVSSYSGNKSFSGNYSFLHGLYVNGNLSLSGNATLNGIIFAEGNITISGNFTGNATFVSAGNITMTGNVDISGMNGVAMIAAQDLTLTGNKQIKGYLYAGEDINWQGNANLIGGISCKGNLNFGGNVDIRFRDFTDESNLPPGMTVSNAPLTLLSWQEVAVTP
ncbi:MAG: hypothetical protein NUV70_02255 [Caldiserica bacterium]|nr:hypothetical protein [Caldisericota bacterium]